MLQSILLQYPDRMEKEKKNLKEKGNQLYKQGHFGLAAAMYRKYVSKPHEDNKNAYCNMGLCYFKEEKYQQCIEACKEALKIDENYAKVYYRLALAYDKIGNAYQSFTYANEFCRISKDSKSSSDYKQMKELREMNQSKIMYPCPVPVEEKNLLFFPNYNINPTTNKQGQPSQSKQPPTQEKVDYFSGYSWKDVQEKINNGEYRQALDMSYNIAKKESQPKKTQLNKQNIKIVKGIKAGQLPSHTKLFTDPSQLIKEKIQKPNTALPIESENKKEDQEDYYTKHFLKPLEGKPDIFQGFPTVIVSMMKNVSLKAKQVEEILTKCSKEHPMFGVLQMSLSAAQKQEIKKLLVHLKMPSKLIDVYCQ